MSKLYGDELFDDAVIERPAKRPILAATCLFAIAALSVGGLYQGFRITFRDLGPAPSYAQSASARTLTPAPAPDVQMASQETHAPGDGAKLELADNDAASPDPNGGSPSKPGAVAPIVPVDRAALIPATGDAAQQGVTFDQPASVAGPTTAPDQPPP